MMKSRFDLRSCLANINSLESRVPSQQCGHSIEAFTFSEELPSQIVDFDELGDLQLILATLLLSRIGCLVITTYFKIAF